MEKPDRLGNILTQAEREATRLDSTVFEPFSLTALGIAIVVGASIVLIIVTAAA